MIGLADYPSAIQRTVNIYFVSCDVSYRIVITWVSLATVTWKS